MLTRLPLLVIAFWGSIAFADDKTEFGEVGDWAILVDPSVGNGCLMQKEFSDQTLVQMGILPKRKGEFFAVYNPAWSDIEEGMQGVIRIDFGDALFEGSVVGKFQDGIPGGLAFFDNPAFTDEFAKRDTVMVIGKVTGHQAEIDLTGTTKAIAAVRSCQEQQPKN